MQVWINGVACGHPVHVKGSRILNTHTVFCFVLYILRTYEVMDH